MRRFALVLAVTLTLAMAAPVSATTGGSRGCFGAFVSNSAHHPPGGASNLGRFLSVQARSTHPWGQLGIPFFKSLACN